MENADAVLDNMERYIKEIERLKTENLSMKHVDALMQELAELREKLGKKRQITEGSGPLNGLT